MLERTLHWSDKYNFDGALRSAAVHAGVHMESNHISRSAIKRLHTELDRFVLQAEMEIGDPRTRPLGVLRLDLIEQCRRRLDFLSYMAKDAKEHAAERRRGRDTED
jgi:hypothetical protein